MQVAVNGEEVNEEINDEEQQTGNAAILCDRSPASFEHCEIKVISVSQVRKGSTEKATGSKHIFRLCQRFNTTKWTTVTAYACMLAYGEFFCILAAWILSTQATEIMMKEVFGGGDNVVTALAMGILFCLTGMSLSALGIYGVTKKNFKLLIPYLSCDVITFLALIVFSLWCYVNLLPQMNNDTVSWESVARAFPNSTTGKDVEKSIMIGGTMILTAYGFHLILSIIIVVMHLITLKRAAAIKDGIRNRKNEREIGEAQQIPNCVAAS